MNFNYFEYFLSFVLHCESNSGLLVRSVTMRKMLSLISFAAGLSLTLARASENSLVSVRITCETCVPPSVVAIPLQNDMC